MPSLIPADPTGDPDTVAQLLATSDEDRRFELIVEFVKAEPALALAEAERLVASDDPVRRTLGADIFGRMVWADSPLVERVGDILIPRVVVETDPSALDAAIAALGNAGDERARSAVVGRATFDDEAVQLAVACALPSLSWMMPPWLPSGS